MAFAETGLPRTVQEAVDQMLAALSPEDKELVRNTDEEDLMELHFGLGAGIRETFQLWQGNKDLLKSCGSEKMHPDDASMAIIKALWTRLQARH